MATDRSLTVVTTPAQKSPDAFAACVQRVVEACDDVASEEAWQAIARLVIAHWQELNRDQLPASTMTMMAKCTETILRIRRAAQQAQGQSGADALAEFREFMGEVTGRDG